MENKQTAIDWLVGQLENQIVLSAHNKLGTVRTGEYRIGLRKAIDFCGEAKEMEIREQALFLRWLLKHYSTHTTEDGFVCYVDSMGKETDIKNIINHYNDERS